MRISDWSSDVCSSDLPASPFATDTAVQNAINSLNGTTAQQTSTLNGTLQQILAALTANDNGTGGPSLGYLPGLSGIRLDRTNNPLRKKDAAPLTPILFHLQPFTEEAAAGGAARLGAPPGAE